MSEFTNVLQLLNQFCDSFRSALVHDALIGTEPWQNLLEEINGIKDLLNDPVIGEPLDNHQLQPTNPVEKFGASSMVIALYEDNMTTKAIADYLQAQQLPIEERDVKAYLKSYSQAGILDRADMKHGSIFDTQSQLQSIFDQLHTLLIEAQSQSDQHYASARTTKEQIQLEYMKEIRQSVKDAAALAAVVANMQSVENFKKVVIEEVNKLDPATSRRIWQRLRESKVIYSTLSPN